MAKFLTTAVSVVLIIVVEYLYLDWRWGHPFSEWLDAHLPIRKPRHKPKHAKKLFRRRH